MLNRYTMSEASLVANRGAQDIENWLRSFKCTLEVINVENEPEYQARDIDLIWVYCLEGIIQRKTIEIKADTYYGTGNYFFETISNEGKGTPGCFLYTAADLVYYYFVEEKELHVLPMPATRNWFLSRLQQFKEKKTSTPIRRNRDFYVTVGRLVPRTLVSKEVPGVKVFNLK